MLLLGKGPSHKALCSALNIPRARISNNGVPYTRVVTRTFRSGLRRFGSQPYNLGPNVPIVYWGYDSHGQFGANPSLNSHIVFDKLQQLRYFHGVEPEINAPIAMVEGRMGSETIGGGIDWEANSRWLGRRRHHMAGRDITGPFTTEQMRDRLRRGLSDYGVQLIQKTHEWRVHSFNGEIIRIARKVWNRGDELPVDPVWNAERGWHFRYDVDLRDRTRQELGDLATSACRALRMDFGAVDIIGRRKDSGRFTYWILEVNSAPGVADNEHTCRAYADSMRRWEASLNE